MVTRTQAEEEALELGISPSVAPNAQVFVPKDGGCSNCQFSGYLGRTGIHELLIIDEAIQSKIMQHANATQIRAAASNLKSLRADGAEKVLQGVTSFEEIIRVTQEDLVEQE